MTFRYAGAFLAFHVCTIAALGTSCGLNPYFNPKVIQQVDPNPFSAGTQFAVEPVRFEGAEIKVLEKRARVPPFDKAEYSHELDAEQMVAINAEYFKSLAERARESNKYAIEPATETSNARFVIRAQLKRVVLECNPTMKSEVTIAGQDGQILDEFEVEVVVNCIPTFVDSEPWEPRLGRAQAKATADYLEERVAGGHSQSRKKKRK